MKTRCIAIIAFWGFLIAASLINPKRLSAQTATDPVIASSQESRASAQLPQTVVRPKEPQAQIPLRTTLAGLWKFNHDESDDPLQEVRSAESQSSPNAGGYPGSYPGGYPSGGNPGGGSGGGNPGRNPGGYSEGFPAGSAGIPRNTGHNISDNPKMQPLIHPSETLTVDLQNPEIDVKNDQPYELTLYTDGRQLPKKSTDDNHEQVLAHWNGSQLVSDEKSPLGGKMSRTFELSQDGRKLFETLHIDNRRSSALVIHYVYDASSTGVQSGPGTTTDSDHPVLNKPSDGSDSSPQ